MARTAARRLPAVPDLDPLSMSITPMSLRTDYQISPRGHRIRGYRRGETVIDTDWQSTLNKATAAYGRALAGVAAACAARYTVPTPVRATPVRAAR